jgi:hypothetical protein
MTPDFECLYDEHECVMLRDAYQAITQCDLWDWLRSYIPAEGRGFMLANEPELEQIQKAMTYTGHSGASYATTMRAMHAIARANGWDAYKARAIACWPKSHPVCPCRMKRGMTIGWCGVAGGGVPGCEH